jgi:hypothetical protein
VTDADIIHISLGGPDRFITDANGKLWTFEMHRYFGPSVLTKNGDIAKRQPGEKSPFWHAFTAWSQQGERVDENGRCIWIEPEKPRLIHLGGRNYAIEGSAIGSKALQDAQSGEEKQA